MSRGHCSMQHRPQTDKLMKVNRFLKAGCAGLMLALMSCSSPSLDGTYEGILPAADCPGIYVLLAVNGDKYELLEKYMLHPETFVTYGKVESTEGGKGLHLDNRMELEVGDNGLFCQEIPLKRISSETVLPDLYTDMALKDNETGENVTVRLYGRGEKKYADFNWADEVYKLKLENRNDSVSEYRDSNRSLKFIVGKPADFLSGKIVLDGPGGPHSFIRLTPVYNVYSLTDAKGDTEVPSFYDVVYYNGDAEAHVKLITADRTKCYTLTQTEASAKTAVYTDGKVEWHLGNHRNATLILDGKIYTYKENN